ncbi:hypothetical protein [Azospirillum sp. sgz301742]
MRPLLHCGCIVVAALLAQPAAAEDLLSGFDWPALNWGGGTSYSISSARAAGESTRTMRQAVTQSLEGSTYVYAPWLAGVTGTLNVTKAVGSSQSSSESSLMLTGNATIGILPRSLYPVEISYNRYNSALSYGTGSPGAASDITGDSFQLQSRILSFEKTSIGTTLSVSRTRSDDGFQENYKEADISATRSFDKDDVNLRLTYRDRDFSRPDGTSELGRASSLSWRYRSVPFLDVTTESVTTIRYSTLESQVYSEKNLVFQGVSTALWRPKELPELGVSAAMRTYSQNGTAIYTNTNQRTQSAYQTAFVDLGASYLFAPRLIGNIGFDAGYDASKQQQVATTPTSNSAIRYGTRTNLSYTSASQQLMGFDWNWNSSAGATARHSSAGVNHQETVNIGHSGRYQLELPYIETPFALSLSQSVGTGYADTGYLLSLSHSASISRSAREGKNWDYAQVSISDSRAFGTAATDGQLIHAQFTRGYDPDRFTSLSGSVTYQIARFRSATGEAVATDTLSGSISFRQSNVFGMERLNFTSDISLEPPSMFRSERSFFSTSQLGVKEQDPGLGTQRWTNRLDYTIGKLRASLIGRVMNTPKGIGESVFFQLGRSY